MKTCSGSYIIKVTGIAKAGHIYTDYVASFLAILYDKHIL